MDSRLSPSGFPHPLKGLSLLETIFTVAVIGILAAGAAIHYGSAFHGASYAKLESDVRSVNQAIRIYVANGGSFSGLSSPQDILDKMKTVRSAHDDARYAGFGGSMVDPRLAAKITSGDNPPASRAVWKPSLLRFEIASHGHGVSEFYLDESLARTSYGLEQRTASALSYNVTNGWIWNYADAQPLPRPAPFFATLLDGGDDLASGESLPNPWPDPLPVTLNPPAFSLASGDYPPSSFNLQISLSNPNPSSSTWIVLSINGSPYATYGGPLLVAPDTEVAAYVQGDPYYWLPSPTAQAIYAAALPAPLLPPGINPSQPRFLWDSAETITVTLQDFNDSSVSSLEYQIAENGWTSYEAPFDLAISHYLAGTTVAARAVPLTVDYSVSTVVTAGLEGPLAPVQLQRPIISPSASQFHAGSVESITIMIEDPNPAGSTLVFRLEGGPWQAYSAPFHVTWTEYPSGLTVEARARATSPAYLDSEIAVTAIGVSPRPSVFNLFCNSSLKDFGVTVLDGGQFKLSHVDSGVIGSVAIAPGATWNISNGGVTEEFTIHPGNTGSGGDTMPGPGGSPLSPIPRDLSSLRQTALDLSAMAAAMPPTQTFGKIGARTISATSPNKVNVIQITEISLSGGNHLVLSGDSDDYFVLNISSKVSMSGGSTWSLTGGLKASNVIINMLPSSSTFTGSGGSGVLTGAIILAPHPKNRLDISSTSFVVGSIVVGHEFSASGGAQVVSDRCGD